MTQAICMRCGARKIGALTPCPECRFDPATPEEKARSIVLSDHHLDPLSLENAAKAIRAGEEIPIPEDLLAGYAQTIATTPDPRGVGCFMVLLVGGIFATGIALVAAVVAFVGGRWITGLHRVGAGLAVVYVGAFCAELCFLLEQQDFEGRDRKKRWVLLNALPVAAVTAWLVVSIVKGRL
jgi:hypothetical protein